MEGDREWESGGTHNRVNERNERERRVDGY